MYSVGEPLDRLNTQMYVDLSTFQSLMELKAMRAGLSSPATATKTPKKR
jgi:hypothetical protein